MSYQPPSRRRRGFRFSKGAVGFCFVLALIGGFIAFVIIFSKPEPEVALPPLAKPAFTELKVDDDALKKENASRQADARAVTYGGGDFYRRNAYVYPTGYTDSAMTGAAGTTPQPTKLTFYKTVQVTVGTQKPVTDGTTLRFVANAVCAASGSGTLADARGYMYVVQYAIKTPEGAFSPQCLKL